MAFTRTDVEPTGYDQVSHDTILSNSTRLTDGKAKIKTSVRTMRASADLIHIRDIVAASPIETTKIR